MNKLLIKSLKRIVARPAFMNTLNDKFADFMRDPKIQKKVIEQAEDYSEGYTDDEVLERAFDEIYPAWMREMEQKADFSNNGVVVHRGISANNFEDIDLNKVGIFWTWDKDMADNYSGHNTKLPLHILTALVRLDDIELMDTFLKIVWPGYWEGDGSEREIQLKENRKLYLDTGEQIKT